MSSSLRLENVVRIFEPGTVNEKIALDHLDLSVAAGEFVTVLGSNGSGKSTMFNIILGSMFPDEGRVILGDRDITRMKDYRRAYDIGCLYQNPLRGTAPNLTLGAAEKVMELTKKIVEEKKITTLMVTHDMDYALEYGTRTILLDSGKILMDICGEERAAMTPGQLAEIFYNRTRRRGSR